jgi:hypothetical protein
MKVLTAHGMLRKSTPPNLSLSTPIPKRFRTPQALLKRMQQMEDNMRALQSENKILKEAQYDGVLERRYQAAQIETLQKTQLDMGEIQNALISLHPGELQKMTYENITLWTHLQQAVYLFAHAGAHPQHVPDDVLNCLDDICSQIECGAWQIIDNPGLQDCFTRYRTQIANRTFSTPETCSFSEEDIMAKSHLACMRPTAARKLAVFNVSKDFEVIFDQNNTLVDMLTCRASQFWPAMEQEISSYHMSIRKMALAWKSQFEQAELNPGDELWVDPPIHVFPFVRVFRDTSGHIHRFLLPSTPQVGIPDVAAIRAGRTQKYDECLNITNYAPPKTVPPLPKLPAQKVQTAAMDKAYDVPHIMEQVERMGPSQAARHPPQGLSYAQTAQTAPTDAGQVSQGLGYQTSPPMFRTPAPRPNSSDPEDLLDTLVTRLIHKFPSLRTSEKPAKDIPQIRHNLLASLNTENSCDNTTIIMQAPQLKKYNGMSTSNVGDETLWFSQVVQHAHITHRPLLYTLDAYTTHAANTWVQVKITESLAYQTQQLEIASSQIVTNAVGDLIRSGIAISRLPEINEQHIAESFHQTFLQHKVDKKIVAKKKLLKGDLKMIEGNTLEDYIINFKSLLLESGLDTSTCSTDHYPYIMQFQNGLLPRLSRLGHMDYKGANGTSAPQPFSTLSKYWDFLRLQNLKDVARKENDEETKQKKAYFFTLKKASTPTPNLKRSYVNSLTTPNKRSNTQGRYSLDNRQTNTRSKNQADHAGDFEEEGKWYSTMTPLPYGVIFPTGYKLPQMMEDCKEVSHRIVEVMKRIFPHVKPGVHAAICQKVA